MVCLYMSTVYLFTSNCVYRTMIGSRTGICTHTLHEVNWQSTKNNRCFAMLSTQVQHTFVVDQKQCV